MNQFNKVPKNTDKKKLLELPYVLDDLKKEGKEGWFRVARFQGQTHLYIRQDRIDSLGKEKIIELAESIYTKEVLEKFAWMQIEYKNSLMLDLPPQKDEQDKRVEQLISAIENFK